MKIKKICGLEVLDSRGFPTVQCNLLLDNDVLIKSSVPSGASVGKLEALELRDGDKDRYFGKGVLAAIKNIDEKIAPAILGRVLNFKEIDKILLDLDGTENKSSLGANAILAVSIAVARAQALVEKKELYQLIADEIGNKNIILPKVMFNILNGGAHADNGIPFQEFMILPMGDNFFKNLEMSVVVYQNLKNILKKNNYSVGVGDEGGFAPKISGSGKDIIKKTLDLLVAAVTQSGFEPGRDISFCLDVAASQFYDSREGVYILGNEKLKLEDMISFYDELITSYSISSIEDALDEQDWDGWKLLTDFIGSRVQLVGDDIFVTNSKLIQKGIDQKVANAVLIKPNQIGTVTEALSAIKLAKDNGYKSVVSHRSGETCDTFIADLVVGAGVGLLKAGAACRGERVAKYNRLLEIEANL
ncbi:MAG: phosphopyruvate hydratase [bacterium]